MKGIRISDLSKNFQEAIYVTRQLGVNYLWVDSLCIVQDDHEDWDLEARRMAAIYEGAYCTIAATAAKDGTGGFFVPHQAQNLVRLPCRPNDEYSGHIYFGTKDKSAVKRMFQGPLNARGWVLQEHIFSRRLIHFAADQTYWECDKHFRCEDGSEITGEVDMDFETVSFQRDRSFTTFSKNHSDRKRCPASTP